MLKSLLKPTYRKVIAKLRNSLHLDEHTRLLNHIIEQNEVLQKDRAILSHQLYMLSILLAGTEPTTGSDAFSLSPEDTAQDIVNILSPRKQNEVEIVQMLHCLDKDIFKNKSVCIIGTQNTFLQEEITKRGATQTQSIELISFLASEQQKKESQYVYPAHVGTVNIHDHTDIIFISHPAASSYLLKRRLFGLGAKIAEKGLFVLTGTDIEKKRLETLITASGFNQVQKLPDGKMSTFDYVELRKKPDKKTPEEISTALYMAYKLPSIE